MRLSDLESHPDYAAAVWACFKEKGGGWIKPEEIAAKMDAMPRRLRLPPLPLPALPPLPLPALPRIN